MATTQQPITAAEKQQNAIAIKEQTVLKIIDSVQTKVQSLMNNEQFDLPPNYSLGNNFKAAQLAILEAVDKNGNPAVEVCTQQSIANFLLNMVVQGLSVIKDQCYPIVRANKLCLDVSYFGNMALAQRIDPTIDRFVARAVRKGEVFEYETMLDGTGDKIIKHQTTLESLNSTDFIGGYVIIIYNNGKPPVGEVMTYTRIKEAWKMSPQKPVLEDGSLKAGTFHANFTEEAIKRTLINHITKPIIKSSDDGSLFSQSIIENDLEIAEAMAYERISENANTGDVIDVIIDEETGEITNYGETENQSGIAQGNAEIDVVEEPIAETISQPQTPHSEPKNMVETQTMNDGQVKLGGMNGPFRG